MKENIGNIFCGISMFGAITTYTLVDVLQLVVLVLSALSLIIGILTNLLTKHKSGELTPTDVVSSANQIIDAVKDASKNIKNIKEKDDDKQD